MLIFNIVIITVNIRILNMSSQISIFLVLLCIFGVATYYLMFFLIEILFYTDVRNTLQHQLSTWLYWVLIVLYVFVVEGIYYLSNRAHFVELKLRQFRTEKTFRRDVEIKLIHKESINLEDINL